MYCCGMYHKKDTDVYRYVHTKKKNTSDTILLKKSYGRFQFQVKNPLHWTVQLVILMPCTAARP
jgi:hypothetical protein